MANDFVRMLAASSQVRASDVERERTCDALREHYMAGRLSSEELEARVERACQAVTRGDLRGALLDLPSDRGARVAQAARRANRAAIRAHTRSYLAVNGGLVALWGVTGAGEFWPVWPIAGWGIGLWAHWRASRRADARIRRRLPQAGPSGSSRALPR
ncbi:MAG: hypothetical protein QOD53_2302 [Thermoleophilaceae bacterium]|jgi:hypothetical protein|nr:hypothetical protein [Thermoleophilaceae bacterium]